MKTIRAFGYDWETLNDIFSSGKYVDENVTAGYGDRKNPDPRSPEFSTNRQINLYFKNGNSSGIKLKTRLGAGTYVLRFTLNVNGIDPSLVAAAWTHDTNMSTKLRREVDAEFAKWGDENSPDNFYAGVFQNSSRVPGLNTAAFSARNFLHHEVQIFQNEKKARVAYNGFRRSTKTWKACYEKEFLFDDICPVGDFKIALWNFSALLFPESRCVIPRMTIDDFKFYPEAN